MTKLGVAKGLAYLKLKLCNSFVWSQKQQILLKKPYFLVFSSQSGAGA